MQTDRIQIAVRPRRSWEAIDLGFEMARRWWRSLYGAWLAIVVPIGIACIGASWGHPWYALALLWWLKPVFDRVALFVCSEALFGHTPRVVETLRAAPSLLRTGVVLSLTLSRLSPVRAMSLPVLQLERLRGDRRRTRTRLLIGREYSTGVGLLAICTLFQLFSIASGLLLLVSLFLPENQEIGVARLVEKLLLDLGGPWEQVVPFVYLVSMSTIEPLYIAAGFALYINRRVYLEGWDIDLVFRRIGRRAPGEAAGRAGTAAAGVLIALCLLAAGASPALAQTPDLSESCQAPGATPERCIQDVLRDPRFGHTETREGWYLKDFDFSSAPKPDDADDGASQVMAQVLQVLIWVAAAFGAIVILYRMLQGLPTTARDERAPSAQSDPLEVAALVDPATLPDDVAARARELFAAGNVTAALSVLYRGALHHLLTHHAVELPKSATEGECSRVVRRHGDPALASDFDHLTRLWLHAAYAETRPAEASFLDACERWSRRLRPTPGTAGEST